MDSILLGLAHSRYYCVEPSAFAVFRSQLMAFLGSRGAVRYERTPATCALAAVKKGQLLTPAAELTHFRTYEDYDDEEEEEGASSAALSDDEKIVHIIKLTGPMTRGGGACSYGSIEMRDRLMQMADRENVIGHIIYCRTPGGDANTLMDYRKAIDYIHSKGQKIYMFCDGTVASGGAFLSAMCDGVYAYNEDDQIGSLGMYAAFFTLANGAKNSITQETYCECYAERSTDKNLWYRKATEGDTSMLEEDLRNHLDELLANLHADRTSITDDQMTGKMYRMKDVVGTLIDGICSLPELVEKMVAEHTETTTESSAKEDSQTKSLTDMKEYKELAAMAGYEPDQTISADKEGMVSLQAEEADAMEAAALAKKQVIDSLIEENARMKEQLEAKTAEVDAQKAETENREAEVVRLSQELEEAKAGLESTAEQAKQDQDALNAAVASVKEEMDKALADLKSAKEAVEAQLKADTDRHAAEMAEMAQTITDLKARLEEAESGENAKMTAGGSPASNGATPALQMGEVPGWNPNLTPSENAKAMQDYLDKLKRR